MAAEVDALKNKLADREQQLTRTQRNLDDMCSAFDAYRTAVDRRRATEADLLNHYRAAAELARLREAPPRWLH